MHHLALRKAWLIFIQEIYICTHRSNTHDMHENTSKLHSSLHLTSLMLSKALDFVSNIQRLFVSNEKPVFLYIKAGNWNFPSSLKKNNLHIWRDRKKSTPVMSLNLCLHLTFPLALCHSKETRVTSLCHPQVALKAL